MISAPQPEAVEAGLEAFKRNGNVMDAAIGAALVQTVVDPQMCGIAGFGSMQDSTSSIGDMSLRPMIRRNSLAVRSHKSVMALSC